MTFGPEETKKEETPKKDAEREALNALRERIDEIDDQIHDLLMERTNVVHGVAKIKNANLENQGRKLDNKGHPVPSLAMRPEREASIFRRLKSRHSGELPFHVITQLWRELINAKTRLQGPLAISLFHGDETILPYGSRDLARASYGAATTLKERQTPFEVLDDVMRVPGVIGVLPQPQKGDSSRWWPLLLEFDHLNAEHGSPRIIARLPCVEGEATSPSYPISWTIACFDQVSSGDDTSFFVVEKEAVDPEAIRNGFKAHGLGVDILDQTERLVFLSSNEFVGPDDPRLEEISADLQATMLRQVGGFANPIDLSE
jgi:chorismate mutase / prephenate dehydratase